MWRFCNKLHAVAEILVAPTKQNIKLAFILIVPRVSFLSNITIIIEYEAEARSIALLIANKFVGAIVRCAIEFGARWSQRLMKEWDSNGQKSRNHYLIPARTLRALSFCALVTLHIIHQVFILLLSRKFGFLFDFVLSIASFSIERLCDDWIFLCRLTNKMRWRAKTAWRELTWWNYERSSLALIARVSDKA